jgi:hypothetical protein
MPLQIQKVPPPVLLQAPQLHDDGIDSALLTIAEE